VSHLKLVVDNSARDESEGFAEESDPTEELEYQYEQLMLARDLLRQEREANTEYFESRLDPNREIHGIRLVTWIRLAIIGLFTWYIF